jgi:hypothetical protein
MSNFSQIKAIQTALSNNDVTTATDLVKKLRKDLVGPEGARILYECSKCELACSIRSGIDNFDTKFCLEEMKSGNGAFIQKDVSIGV